MIAPRRDNLAVAGCWLLALSLGVACAGPRARGGIAREPTDGLQLRLAAYNIRHGVGLDQRLDLDRTAAVLRALDADLIALQEVDKGCRRSGKVDQAERLAELAGYPHHAFGAFMEYDGGEYGMALLSRSPLRDVRNIRLPAGAEPRTALAAVIEKGDAAVRVVGIHFYETEQERLAQARGLLAVLAGFDNAPTVWIGDFNSEPGDGVMTWLAGRGWSLVPKAEKRPFTFPATEPRVEIDHVLLRPRDPLVASPVVVVDERLASDHRPLVVDLVLH